RDDVNVHNLLLSSVETKLLSKVEVGRLWITVQMIVSSYSTLTMVVLEFLVSSVKLSGNVVDSG
ncbi:unnamed protein product, partial [Arabidopsis halleri]